MDDKKENNTLVSAIRNALTDLKDKIKIMSETEKRIEEPDKIVNIVEKIKINKTNNHILQICMNWTVKNLLNREKVRKDKD